MLRLSIILLFLLSVKVHAWDGVEGRALLCEDSSNAESLIGIEFRADKRVGLLQATASGINEYQPQDSNNLASYQYYSTIGSIEIASIPQDIDETFSHSSENWFPLMQIDRTNLTLAIKDQPKTNQCYIMAPADMRDNLNEEVRRLIGAKQEP